MSIKSIFKNKNVVVTGHTGFKGSWLTAWLKLLGSNVTGISLDLPTKPSHFDVANLSIGINDLRIDIRDKEALQKSIELAKPDFVFHLAAQSLVQLSYIEPVKTWETNLFGTINVLEALRKLKKPCVAVIITSDKCYGNVEWVWGYRETDSLGGPDPYSASKASAELAIQSYIKSFFPKKNSNIRIASARAGNVIGGGDWAKDRIVVDCVKAWSCNKEVELRNPKSIRPWQHVLEPLSGYLNLAKELTVNQELHGEPFNFGPLSEKNYSVLELVELMAKYWKQVSWRIMPNKNEGTLESSLLKINCDKALYYLSWNAAMGFEDTVRLTSEWYKAFYQNPDLITNMTSQQIEFYTQLAKEKKLSWTQ